MHHNLRLLLTLLALSLFAGCAGAPMELLSPPLTVTPVKGVVDASQFSPAATPTPALAEATSAEIAVAATPTETLQPSPTATVELPPTATPAPTDTPIPVRTPVRLKAPGQPAVLPTDTPPAIATVVTTAPLAPAVNVSSTITVTIPTPNDNTDATKTTLDDTLNILVVGSDERQEGQPWRSDVIMVVAVDFANRQVGVISFPRDLWVRIPTVGENRINTATFFGGVQDYENGGDIGLLKDTLAQNFGIRIDQYVKVNFGGFQDIIDALGGIDVVVDCPIAGNFPREPGSKQLVYQTLQPGEYHMDGVFALRYARERKSTSDIDRTRRQQRVLIAIRNRAREINIIPRLPALYDALRDTFKTDLGLTDIIALARLGILIDPDRAHGFIIDFRHTDSWVTPDGAAVLLPQMNAINEKIRTLFDQPSILKSPSKPRSCQTE